LNLSTILFVCGILTLAWGQGESGHSFQPLTKKFAELEKLQEDNFQRLVFQPSDKKLNQSAELKFLLRDQLGRDWLFKSEIRGSHDGAIAVHRLNDLFGIEDPEMHYATFTINGEKLKGSLQRFIPNKGGMIEEQYFLLSPEAADFMARTHVFSWLLTNNQLHADQYLILPSEGREIKGLVRVDNSMNWYLLGQDRLDIDYRVPMMHTFGSVGYLQFWRTYITRTINLDLPGLLSWADFIAHYPDAEYSKFFEAGIANGLKYMGNNGTGDIELLRWQVPELVSSIDAKRFLPLILERKRKLSQDLRPVYEKVAKLRGEKVDWKRGENFGSIQARLLARLDQKIASARADSQALAAAGTPGTQKPLELPISLNGYRVLRDYMTDFWMPIPKQLEANRVSLRKLKEFARNAKAAPEREALKNAVANFMKVQRLHDMVVRKEVKMKVPDFRKLTLDLNDFFSPRWEKLEQAMIPKGRD
jgi:hypothetical protein